MKNSDFNQKNVENLQQLLNLMTAYQQSNVLFAFEELQISKILGEKKLNALDIAKVKKIHPLAMERFLNAAVTIGLLKKDKNSYSNSKMTEKYLIKGNEFYLGGQIERHRKRSFKAWSKLTKSLKNWKYGSHKKPNPETQDQGAEAMTEQHNFALFQGFALAKAFDFSKYKKVLDLGGGTGATSIALCKTYPKLKSVVFDLPENAELAQKFISENELNNQIEIIGGDFKKDALPNDFDAVLLANFMSVADVYENKKLLKKLYKKLPNDGVCILSGWIIDDSKLAPQISVLFCLEDICWDATDVERSEKVYSDWLRQIGFQKIACETYLEPTKMLYGFKK